ncbi:MAG: flagellar basal-body rod protein FlgF [Spirochaetales bacterium]|nr:flagellar basal-body rod protein FlgF [Spirochaetales bacterium]
MIRGIYTGASGMIVQMHEMDALANNLANVDLTGYKRDVSAQKSFPELLLRRTNDNGVYKFPFGSIDTAPVVGKIGTGVEFNELYTVFEQGSLRQTENPFDVALEGEGFFVIQTNEGEKYTRNGTFTIDPNGILVTKEGFPVLGENGVIHVKKNNFVIDQAGNIFHNAIYADDPMQLVTMEQNDWEQTELLDKLRVVDFDRKRYLKKTGTSMWEANEESGAARAIVTGTDNKVIQGFIEKSNVNSVTEMVRMIEINRAYEASQKSVQTHDSLAGRFIQSMKV